MSQLEEDLEERLYRTDVALREARAQLTKAEEALRDCQRDLVAVHGAMPSWCQGATLAERVAHVVSVAEVLALGRGPHSRGRLTARAREADAAKALTSPAPSLVDLFDRPRRWAIPIIRDEPPLPDPRGVEDIGIDPLADDLGGEG